MKYSSINKSNKIHGILFCIKVLTCILFICSSLKSYSQNPYPNRSTNFPTTGNGLGQDSIDQEVLEDIPPDTIRLYTPYQLKKAKIFSDTTLDDQFHQYEAIRLQDIPYLNIGNNGSPYRSAIYAISKRQGLDIGSHVLDLYRLKYDDLELTDSKRALTVFRFVQKSFSQQDLQLDSKFRKSFQNGLHLGLQYRTINYKGEFNQQINKDRSGAFNIWYHSPKGNYDLIANFLTNDFKLQDNGGLNNVDSLMKVSLYRGNTLSINTNNIDGRSHQKETAFSIQNGFNISVRGSTLGFSHLISTSNQIYTYSDKTSQPDSIYYTSLYSPDSVSVAIKTKGLINEFRVTGQIRESASLMAGLRHELHSVNQNNIKSNLNLLFLNGSYAQSFGKGVHLNSFGQWGLLENFGEYYLKGDLEVDSKRLGALEGHAIFQRSPVPILFNQLFINSKSIYANNFAKPISNQIGGLFFIQALKLKAGIDQSIITNTIYLDSLRIPKQESSAISITSVFADKSFRFGKFYSRHRLTLQVNSNNNIMRSAPWFTQNQIYYQDMWFHDNMFLQAGFDSRVYPGFKTNSYFPVLGNFYNSANPTNLSLHPSVEFFFNFQLKNFRGFFKMEGLEYFIYPTGKVFYEIYNQPLFRTNTRLGLTWILRD